MRNRVNFGVLVIGLLAAVWSGLGRADTTSSYTPGEGVNLVLNSTGKILLRGLQDTDACIKAAEAEGEKAQANLVYRCDPVHGLVAISYTAKPVAIIAPAPAPRTDAQTQLRVKAFTGSQVPVPSDIGSFRIPCGYSHTAPEDPIVFPGKPGASHLHTFFGNMSVDTFSTTESLLAAKRSTCGGGIANLSAYWIPSVIDPATNRALVPKDFQTYYKKGYNDLTNAEIKIPPNGLRMVAGNSATATTPPNGGYARFACGKDPWQTTIQACPAGSELHLTLMFPNCWDGKNLDSPDHRSHMVYARAYSPKRCPASHPVPIPTIELNTTYIVEAGANASRYRLSSDKYDANLPGGYSFHGDVWLAWDESIKATWMANCINAAKDCHSFLLGDGRTLY